jgi:hypothetical protein
MTACDLAVLERREHFDGMAQECVRWLPGCIGSGVVLILVP